MPIMDQQNQDTPSIRPNGLKYSFGTSGSCPSFTWSPPTSSESLDQLDHSQVLHGKRRRLNEVEVSLTAHGVANIRLGEETTLDFTLHHKDSERQLLDVKAERDQLLQQLDEAIGNHEKALSDYKATEERRIHQLRLDLAGTLLDNRLKIEQLEENLDDAKEDHEETKLELKMSEDNYRAVSGLLSMRERELKACRDENAKEIDRIHASATKHIGENDVLRAKVSELQDALKKQRQHTVIEL